MASPIETPARERLGVSPYRGFTLFVVQWVTRVVFGVWFRYRKRGWQGLPRQGPVLLVANHASHLDPVLVGAVTTRRLFYLARSSLFRSAIFAAAIRKMGAVPVEREGHGLGGLRTTLALLDAGCAVVVFPEGTRTRDGTVGDLRPGVARIAQRSGAPVLPVWIEGSFAAFPRGTRFPRPRHIEVRVGLPFRVPADLDPDRVLELVKEQWQALGERRPVPAPGGQIPVGK